jgi:transcriptional regulator with PAS, ATPase and Fis domain
MAEIEKYAILETLRSVGGSTGKAAKVLGISVRKIQYRLKDWNLRPAQFGGGTAVVEARH